MSKEKYLNFPIQLLVGFMIDSKKVLYDISVYAVYENSLKLELGTDLEKIKTSASFYNMTLGSDKNTFDKGKTLYNSIPTNSPKVGLSISMFWDFYKNDKSEFDKICFLAFLSIKSILGAKSYCKTTNAYLWARMDGKTSTIIEVSELSNEIIKYANEYQTKKIKTALRNNWGLVTYARYTRGFYISFKITLKQLMLEAEKRRESTKEKQYKEQEKELLKEVLEQLKTTRP
ncbi:hypothetical protein QMU91_000102 [Flavobacterium psychrophilum]|nr:hypothetical protein [Flavobacterium psychrophilum]